MQHQNFLVNLILLINLFCPFERLKFNKNKGIQIIIYFKKYFIKGTEKL